jgi:hypothetical protein
MCAASYQNNRYGTVTKVFFPYVLHYIVSVRAVDKIVIVVGTQHLGNENGRELFNKSINLVPISFVMRNKNLPSICT